MKKNTLEKRAVAASAKQAGALSLFHRAADDLAYAADEHRAIAEAHREIADAHTTAAGESVQAAAEASNAARKLRDLIAN